MRSLVRHVVRTLEAKLLVSEGGKKAVCLLRYQGKAETVAANEVMGLLSSPTATVKMPNTVIPDYQSTLLREVGSLRRRGRRRRRGG